MMKGEAKPNVKEIGHVRIRSRGAYVEGVEGDAFEVEEEEVRRE
jgi:sorbitol-specific phosphotransferase system component IIA